MYLRANRVNLCLISADGSAGGDYRGASALLPFMCETVCTDELSALDASINQGQNLTHFLPVLLVFIIYFLFAFER